MSNRTQIFVRFENEVFDGEVHRDLIAMNFDNCLASTTIERARNGLAYIYDTGVSKLNAGQSSIFINGCEMSFNSFTKNHDMTAKRSTNLSTEYAKERIHNKDIDLNAFLFTDQASDGGKLFVDVSLDGTIKYAFLDEANEQVMSASQYMSWQEPDWNKFSLLNRGTQSKCKDAVLRIEHNIPLMTKEEVADFINHDYMGEREKERALAEKSFSKISTKSTKNLSYEQMVMLPKGKVDKGYDDVWGDGR